MNFETKIISRVSNTWYSLEQNVHDFSKDYMQRIKYDLKSISNKLQ